MNKNNLHSVNDMLDTLYGKAGTDTRSEFRKQAYDFCMGQIIAQSRKEEKVTQTELANRIGVNKSYISRIENGDIQPAAGTFLRIIEALGLRMEIVKPVVSV